MSYDERKLNNGKQGSGSGLDADTVDTKDSTELGNTIDNKTIKENTNGDLQAYGLISPSEFSEITTINQSGFGSQITVVDVTLSSSEVAIIHHAEVRHGNNSGTSESFTVDTNSVPSIQKDQVDQGGDHTEHYKYPGMIIATDSFKLTVNGSESVRGECVYRVINV